MQKYRHTEIKKKQIDVESQTTAKTKKYTILILTNLNTNLRYKMLKYMSQTNLNRVTEYKTKIQLCKNIRYQIFLTVRSSLKTSALSNGVGKVPQGPSSKLTNLQILLIGQIYLRINNQNFRFLTRIKHQLRTLNRRKQTYSRTFAHK